MRVVDALIKENKRFSFMILVDEFRIDLKGKQEKSKKKVPIL
jgi:hypothetical protein